MTLKKRFKFENAHIVRNCMTDRCKYNIHGHSYKVETVFFINSSNELRDIEKFYPLMKEFIDSFDHAMTLWSADNSEYLIQMQHFSQRWVMMPLNPSAEQFARTMFYIMTKLFSSLTLQSVTVHETATGYAQAFSYDSENTKMGNIEPLYFSNSIQNEWSISFKNLFSQYFS